ncbi:MAG TPA: nucleoside triphosphate pyrophosphohydrolase [Planctomycetota bacterium]|nr:nucleoside triphosphate pyrophosphohydrolase [Planctomycetota bacterium]
MTASEPSEPSAVARQQGAARAASETESLARLAELVGIVWRLRDPDGCPWDRSQSVDSMALNLVEEACETHEAVANGGDEQIAEELGDTLMNILLIARIAEQERRFDLGAVAAGIATKLVRRHPHVFGDRQAADAQAALASWNEAKGREQAASGPGGRASVLDGIPASLPALGAALRTGAKAAQVGFDWPDAAGALLKLDEELAELRAAVAGGDQARVEDELGDVLFSAVNVARKQGLDPELALRRTIGKFRRRFALIERALGDRLGTAPLEELERQWLAAALRERQGGAPPSAAPPILP